LNTKDPQDFVVTAAPIKVLNTKDPQDFVVTAAPIKGASLCKGAAGPIACCKTGNIRLALLTSLSHPIHLTLCATGSKTTWGLADAVK